MRDASELAGHLLSYLIKEFSFIISRRLDFKHPHTVVVGNECLCSRSVVFFRAFDMQVKKPLELHSSGAWYHHIHIGQVSVAVVRNIHHHAVVRRDLADKHKDELLPYARALMLEELVESSRYVVAVFEDYAVDAFLAQIVSADRFPIYNLAFGFKVGSELELTTLILDKMADFGLAPSE